MNDFKGDTPRKGDTARFTYVAEVYDMGDSPKFVKWAKSGDMVVAVPADASVEVLERAEPICDATEGATGITCRHLKFRRTYWRPPLAKQQVSGTYWFDLITVPGSLIFRGDGESFVFAREEDMFDFFRSSSWAGRPNVGYWAEKVTSERDRLQRYDEELFRQEVKRHVTEYFEPDRPPTELIEAVREEILESDLMSADEALRLVQEFAYCKNPDDRWKLDKRPDFQFIDVWEWQVRDYDWWFPWALEAILWGIGKYDETRGGKSRWQPARPVETVDLPDIFESPQPQPMVTVELPGGAA